MGQKGIFFKTDCLAPIINIFGKKTKLEVNFVGFFGHLYLVHAQGSLQGLVKPRKEFINQI